MRSFSLLLAAGVLLMAAPSANATHSVCHNSSSDIDVIGVIGIDNPNAGMDGVFVCLGTQAVGVDTDLYVGPEYGATVRIITCSGLTCTEVLSNAGVVIGTTGVVRVCIDNPLCPP